MPTPSTQAPRTRRRGFAAHSYAATAAALLIVLPGCAADHPAAGMSTTVDTLPDGATLVRHAPPPDGVPVTWRLEEELRIGTMDGGGPAQFGRVGGLAVAEDGRIAVLDAQAQDIRLFDADGRHLRTLGRKGGGPGEMEGANGIVFGPDGLLRVLDGRNARISYFHLDDGFVRSHPYTPMSLSWMWDGVLDEDGVLWANHFVRATKPGERGYSAYVGYDSAGAVADTLEHPEGVSDPSREDPGAWTVKRDGRTLAMISVPYYPRQQHLLDSRLRIWTTVEGDPAYRLERRPPGGDATLVLQTERPLHPVNAAAADSLAASFEERFGASFDRSKIPEMGPAILSFFIDDDTRLWVVARTEHTDSVRTLDSYDAEDGRWLGTLVTDVPLIPHPRPVIRGDRLWTVVRDELGVQYVVRARLVAAAAER